MNVPVINENQNSNVHELPKELPFEKGTRATVELRMKQIFIAVIIALNIAALVVAYRAIVQYVPLKAEPIWTSSFLVGVLGGLVSIKMPTCGINNGNINQFLNPIALMGRLLAYAFFGPTILVAKAMDLTNYKKEASKISGELKSNNFEFCAAHHFDKLANYKKFGILSEEVTNEIKTLYNDYQALKIEKDKLEPRVKDIDIVKDPINPEKLKYIEIVGGTLADGTIVVGKISKIEDRWKEIQKKIIPVHSKYVPKDWSKWYVRGWDDVTTTFDKPQDVTVA